MLLLGEGTYILASELLFQEMTYTLWCQGPFDWWVHAHSGDRAIIPDEGLVLTRFYGVEIHWIIHPSVCGL